MSISFDNALGIHEQSLKFRAQRAEVLANNIANAETPNYKARDLDFNAVLAAQQGTGLVGDGQSMPVAQTDAGHMVLDSLVDQVAGLRYRNQLQPSVDGNTVDSEVEKAAYAQNAIDFQASFTFLNSKFKGLMTALRGD
ncbi:flagellar basal body rod protein FlgB [Halopseudomonas oceani]|uniref:flagellar basal body rod protein FlgB n=1 Tax=Halopseudomonas oceani TaxID=1708783 RepID=UPI002AA8E35B|nr:flagellar basal body rod protein FlgB [Halopseudomonas oceani]